MHIKWSVANIIELQPHVERKLKCLSLWCNLCQGIWRLKKSLDTILLILNKKSTIWGTLLFPNQVSAEDRWALATLTWWSMLEANVIKGRLVFSLGGLFRLWKLWVPKTIAINKSVFRVLWKLCCSAGWRVKKKALLIMSAHTNTPWFTFTGFLIFKTIVF